MPQKYEKMKYLTIFGGLLAAFLCLAQSANAQYLPDRIHRDGANFVDDHHRVLSDSELVPDFDTLLKLLL